MNQETVMDDTTARTATPAPWPKKRRGWLILTRGPGQELIVDGKILIRIVRIRGDQIRVGISAPTDVLVVRREAATPEQLAAVDGEVAP